MRRLAKALRWTLAILAGLLWGTTVFAQVARDGSVAATATSGTFSATATGDLKVVFAFRSGSTTAPTLPGTYTSIATGATSAGGTPGSFTIGCNISSSSGDTGTGTWTNATAIAGMSYSGVEATATTANCATVPIGGKATNNGKASTTANFATITMTNAGGADWVAGFLGDSGSSLCVPSGMSTVASSGTVRGLDTNAGATSWPSTNCTVSSSTWMTYVLEIKAKAQAGSPPAESNTTTPSVAISVGRKGSPSETTPTCTGTVTGVRCAPVGLTETHVGPDAVTGVRSGSAQNGNVTETVSESDSAATVRSMHAAPSVTLSPSDSVGSSSTHNPSVSLTESLTTTATVAAPCCRAVGLTETHVGPDSVVGAKSSNIVTLTESLTTTATVAVAHGAVVGPSVSLTTTDAVGRLAALKIGLSENHPTNDFSSTGTSPQKNLIEVTVTSEVFSVVPGHRPSLNEVTITSDALLVTKCGALQEFLVTIDGVTVVRTKLVALVESLTTTDTANRGPGYNVTENLTTTAALAASRPGSISVNLNDAQTTSGTVATVRAAVGAITLNLTTSGTVATVRAVNGVLSETLSLTDATTAVSAQKVSLAATLSTADQVQVQSPTHGSLGLTENLVTVPSVAAAQSLHPVLSDTVSTTAVVVAGRGPVAVLTETIPTADLVSVSGVKHFAVALSEVLSTSAALSVSSPHALSFNESHATTDSLTVLQANTRRRFIVVDSQ